MVDQPVQFRYQIEPRHQQAVENRVFFSFQGAEQVVQIIDDNRIAGEKSAVRIEGGGLLVEVSGADVGITGQLVPFFVAA